MSVESSDIFEAKYFEASDNLYDNDDYAGDYYQEYLKNTNENKMIGKWLNDKLPHLIEPFLKKGQKTIKILSIGAGQGIPDCYLLDKISSEFTTIDYTVYDPSVKMTTIFKESVKDDIYPNVNFNWQIRPAKEFLSLQNSQGIINDDKKRYHLVLVFASLYYIPERDELLETLYHSLENDGTMLLSVVAEGCGWHKIWLEFQDRIQQSLGKETNITGEYLREYFSGKRIGHEIETVKCGIKLDKMLTPSCSVGIKLLEYLVDLRQFTQEPVAIQQDILRFAKQKCSFVENDDFYFDVSQQIFIVQK